MAPCCPNPAQINPGGGLVTVTCGSGNPLPPGGVTLSSLHVGRAGGSVALRQLAWFGIGLIALVAVASLDYRRIVRLAPGMYCIGLAALARETAYQIGVLRRRFDVFGAHRLCRAQTAVGSCRTRATVADRSGRRGRILANFG